MANGLDKPPFIQGTHKMLKICHHLSSYTFPRFFFTAKKTFYLKALSPNRRCVCFENLKLLLEQWGKFLHSLRSIERCWSFEKFGSEITCCLRSSFDGTNIRYEIPGTTLAYYRKGIQENVQVRDSSSAIIFYFFASTDDALASCKLCFSF